MAFGATGCSLGVHSLLARNPDQNLTLTPDIRSGSLTGTVDESVGATELSVGGMIGRDAVVVELGASFGVRQVGFESPTDGLTMVKPPARPDGLEGRGFYDAYFAGVMVPVTTVDRLGIGGYARAQVTGLSRLFPSSSASYDLEAGVELDLPMATGPNRIFVRIGGVLEGANYELDMADDIGNATGSTSFFGLTTTIGVRVWER